MKIMGDSHRCFELKNIRTKKNLNLPVQSILGKTLSKWTHLQNIPFKTFSRVRPLLLIGQDNIDLTVPRTVVQGPMNAPIATQTKLGWVVHGPMYRNKYSSRIEENFSLFISDKTDQNEISSLLKRMYEVDFPNTAEEKDNTNIEDRRAMEIINETCRQTEDGHWEVGLLWKEEGIILPESKQAALKRLISVERKMDANEKLANQYCEQMKDYIKKGFARELTDQEKDVKHDRIWYLPHFPVSHPRKPEKFRFVFDAASKTNGQCLNNNLLTGPDLFNNLITLLFLFRQGKIAFTADIQEMFLQVKINKNDQMAQRFLWRGLRRDITPQEMCMQVMIFGAVCSPTLAMFVTRKNADMYKETNPEAVTAINKQCYMDDYIESRDKVEDAAKLANDVIYIFEKGGFNIRNFVTNSRDLLNLIPTDKWAKCFQAPSPEKTETTARVLGLLWNFEEDLIIFNTTLLPDKEHLMSRDITPTKRQVLKVVMSVFDPLGFLSPLMLKGRLLMQDMWKKSTNWDEKLDIENLVAWRKWVEEVKLIKSISIPRCYTQNLADVQDIQLHVFCDASPKGYASVAYFRLTDKTGKINIVFIFGKTRVAPIKPVTIPRLELQSAVLGAKVGNFITSSHSKIINKITYWTDSMITWHRINSDPSKYKIFVARRLEEIKNLTCKENWRWIPTKDNVADEATRGANIKTSRWLEGPSFLKLDEIFWPNHKECSETYEDFEIKGIPVLTVVDWEPIINFDRFSKFIRLIHTIGWVLRFFNNSREKTSKFNESYVTKDELDGAELKCAMMAQRDSFPDELRQLTNKQTISKSSRLYALSPILLQGLIRLNSRTAKSPDLNFDERHPIILDPKHRFTKLLIHKLHHDLGHQGQETVVNTLRQRYWVISCRSAVRSCWKACVTCQKSRAKPEIPLMAPLPASRVTRYSRPFTSVGLDYFGPLEVKIGRRREKRYGALFTCLSIRAVHLELASSLSTDSAIMTIRRMSARRGYPSEIMSDNGTNFRGAERELREALKEIDSTRVAQFCAGKGIKWSFITPSAPHMGGSWERLVRSVKTSLYAVMREQAPQEETLRTIFCEIENIINSRPITFVSSDPQDPDCLTPNLLLIGKKYQLPISITTGSCLRKQWRLAQQFADQFWRRWVREYLPNLANRKKWTKDAKSLVIGDLVLIVDENQPRNHWLTGRIEKVHPGFDGKIRSVDVTTKSGKYRRPAAKLIRIDVNDTFI